MIQVGKKYQRHTIMPVLSVTAMVVQGLANRVGLTSLRYVWHGVTEHGPTPLPPTQKSDTIRQIVRADVRSREHLLHRYACAVASHSACWSVLLSEKSEFKQPNNDKTYQ